MSTHLLSIISRHRGDGRSVKVNAQSSNKSSSRNPGPDNLKCISFPSETGIQPMWISKEYPEYTRSGKMSHKLSSVQVSKHGRHCIKIVTTYKIEIDNNSVHLHLTVGNDGQLHCHTTPYENYKSVMDLVKTLIDRFPEAFQNFSNHDSNKEHGA